jgi:hypothetical protein
MEKYYASRPPRGVARAWDIDLSGQLKCRYIHTGCERTAVNIGIKHESDRAVQRAHGQRSTDKQIGRTILTGDINCRIKWLLFLI